MRALHIEVSTILFQFVHNASDLAIQYQMETEQENWSISNSHHINLPKDVCLSSDECQRSIASLE
jgi:hypothetical protein